MDTQDADREYLDYEGGADEGQADQHHEQSDGGGFVDPMIMPPHGTETFISKIPREATDAQLLAFCQSNGKSVYAIRLPKDPGNTGQNKGYAFVAYHDKEGAADSLLNLNQQELPDFPGRKVTIVRSEVKNKLFVANFPKDLSKEQILDALRADVVGVVDMWLTLEKDPSSGYLNRGFGFVEFYNNTAAEQARRRLTRPDFRMKDNALTVTWAENRKNDAMQETVKSIYVGNLPQDSVSEDKIRSIFSAYGKISNVVMLRDPADPSKPRNYCFVHFEDRSSALKAVEDAADGVNPRADMDGRELVVNMARPNFDKPGFSEGGAGSGGVYFSGARGGRGHGYQPHGGRGGGGGRGSYPLHTSQPSYQQHEAPAPPPGRPQSAVQYEPGSAGGGGGGGGGRGAGGGGYSQGSQGSYRPGPRPYGGGGGLMQVGDRVAQGYGGGGGRGMGRGRGGGQPRPPPMVHQSYNEYEGGYDDTMEEEGGGGGGGYGMEEEGYDYPEVGMGNFGGMTMVPVMMPGGQIAYMMTGPGMAAGAGGGAGGPIRRIPGGGGGGGGGGRGGGRGYGGRGGGYGGSMNPAPLRAAPHAMSYAAEEGGGGGEGGGEDGYYQGYEGQGGGQDGYEGEEQMVVQPRPQVGYGGRRGPGVPPPPAGGAYGRGGAYAAGGRGGAGRYVPY